jgi:hypothetical protein
VLVQWCQKDWTPWEMASASHAKTTVRAHQPCTLDDVFPQLPCADQSPRRCERFGAYVRGRRCTPKGFDNPRQLPQTLNLKSLLISNSGPQKSLTADPLSRAIVYKLIIDPHCPRMRLFSSPNYVLRQEQILNCTELSGFSV